MDIDLDSEQDYIGTEFITILPKTEAILAPPDVYMNIWRRR